MLFDVAVWLACSGLPNHPTPSRHYMKIHQLAHLLTLCAIPALAPTTLHAASIIWGAPTTISGESDVSTHGTLLGAVNWGFDPNVPDNPPPNTTINGVTFTGAHLVSPGSGPFSWTTPAAGSAGGPAGRFSLSSAYRILLNSYGSTTSRGSTLTLRGLIVGQSYEFQWWSDVDGAPFSNAFGGVASARAGNTVTLDSNTTDVEGGFGQYVIGTFVADAATQTISFSGTQPGSQSGAVNGFQLRQIPAPTIPEPGTTLFGLALLAPALTRRARGPV